MLPRPSPLEAKDSRLKPGDCFLELRQLNSQWKHKQEITCRANKNPNEPTNEAWLSLAWLGCNMSHSSCVGRARTSRAAWTPRDKGNCFAVFIPPLSVMFTRCCPCPSASAHLRELRATQLTHCHGTEVWLSCLFYALRYLYADVSDPSTGAAEPSSGLKTLDFRAKSPAGNMSH